MFASIIFQFLAIFVAVDATNSGGGCNPTNGDFKEKIAVRDDVSVFNWLRCTSDHGLISRHYYYVYQCSVGGKPQKVPSLIATETGIRIQCNDGWPTVGPRVAIGKKDGCDGSSRLEPITYAVSPAGTAHPLEIVLEFVCKDKMINVKTCNVNGKPQPLGKDVEVDGYYLRCRETSAPRFGKEAEQVPLTYEKAA